MTTKPEQTWAEVPGRWRAIAIEAIEDAAEEFDMRAGERRRLALASWSSEEQQLGWASDAEHSAHALRAAVRELGEGCQD